MSTRVFISWSGPKSRAVAEALRTWLPRIIQSVQPFMSAVDIAAGSRPMSDIEEGLEDAKFGIICVSSENWEKPWLNFEAGAISKRLGIEETRVSPLLIDLQPEDIDSPLKQFQMKHLDEVGVYEVLQSLNAMCGDGSLSDADLRQTFDVWWPKLDADFEHARSVSPPLPVQRGQEAKIDELLTLIRGISATLASQSSENETSGRGVKSADTSLGRIRVHTTRSDAFEIVKRAIHMLEKRDLAFEVGQTADDVEIISEEPLLKATKAYILAHLGPGREVRFVVDAIQIPDDAIVDDEFGR